MSNRQELISKINQIIQKAKDNISNSTNTTQKCFRYRLTLGGYRKSFHIWF